MKSRAVFCCALAVGLWVAGSGAEELYLQATTNFPGGGGSLWLSDFQAYNNGIGVAEITVEYLPAGDNTTPLAASTAVPAGGSLRIGDVLDALLGVTASTGALRVTPTAGEVVVMARTYNSVSVGTYGFRAPQRRAGESVAFGEQAYLVQLTENTERRTNVGYLNTCSSAIEVELDCYRGNGSFLGTSSVVLAPFEFRQVNRPFAALGATDVADGYVVVRTTTAGGSFLAYANVIDWGSNDPLLRSEQRAPTVGEPVYVPFAAAPGGSQSLSTNLAIVAIEGSPAEVDVELLVTGADNSSPASASYSLAAGQSLRLDNVVATVFGHSGTAALRVTASNGTVLVSSESSAVDNMLHDVPGRPASAAAGRGQAFVLPMLTRTADYTTDVGFVSTTGVATTVVLRTFDAAGVPISSSSHALLPWGHVIVEDALGEDVADAFAVVETTTVGGAILAFATVTDTRTLDASHISGLPANLGLFGDGLESGSTSAWSGTVGGP